MDLQWIQMIGQCPMRLAVRWRHCFLSFSYSHISSLQTPLTEAKVGVSPVPAIPHNILMGKQGATLGQEAMFRGSREEEQGSSSSWDREDDEEG